MAYVTLEDSLHFLRDIDTGSVQLVCIDPPYYKITKDKWDNQWKDSRAYLEWMLSHLEEIERVLTPTGSLLMFGGIGKHGSHQLFGVMSMIEDEMFTDLAYRNMITWKKRRAYGKSHDYLFCREEIVWYSKSPERTEVTFNIPLTNEKRGYPGFSPKYPAKSEYKRVSNVWTDIPELMRPRRSCEKPVALMKRLVETHSNPGDLVVDCFCGLGPVGVAALELGRRFKGCDADPEAVNIAEADCLKAVAKAEQHEKEETQDLESESIAEGT